MRSILVASIAVVVLLCRGCSAKYYRLYPGQKADPSKISVVEGYYPLVLCSIDGKKGPNGTWSTFVGDVVVGSIGAPDGAPPGAICPGGRYNGGFTEAFVVELLPGTHVFEVDFSKSDVVSSSASYTQYSHSWSTEAKLVTLKTQPGVSYLLEPVLHGRSPVQTWEVRVRTKSLTE